MDANQILDYCNTKKGVQETFPFDNETLVMKVGGKMFLLMSLDTQPVSISVKTDPEWSAELREQHQERAATLKARFAAARIPVMESESHIVPVHVGDPVHCKMISDMLLEDFGIYVQPINYPTVPKGTERLRFTPSPNHDDGMIDQLVDAMDKLWSHCNVARQPVAA